MHRRGPSSPQVCGARGFTLMELIVAMALLVVLVATAVPYVAGVLGVQVKGAARQLAGTMRYLFDESVIRSANYRLVFNLDRHSYFVELCPGGSAILYRSADERERSEEQLEELRRRMEDYASAPGGRIPLADTTLQSCSRVDESDLEPVVLQEPITLLGVWTAQYDSVVRGDPDGPPDDPEDDRIAVVNFIKGGYAERAYVYLSDGGDDIYTLELEPLTGEVILHEGEYEVPREYWRQR